MDTDTGPVLDELLEDLAEELEGASASVSDGVTSWQRDGVAFARVSSDVLEVRLPLDIAEAALRTSDTTALADEPGWVRFSPSTDERHVADRAEAWFQSAWRHAPGA